MTNDEHDAVPRLSKSDIEGRVYKLVNWFSSNNLDRPAPTPLGLICDKMMSSKYVEFDFNSDLGVSSRGNKIYGAFDPRLRSIQIDRSLDKNGPQFKFTLAHEIGHFALHRKLRLNYSELDEPTPRISSSRRSFYFHRQEQFTTSRHWLEWHANYFALGLTLPRLSFVPTVRAVQKAVGISRHLGVFYLTEAAESRIHFAACIDALSKIYDAPRTLVTRRLSSLEMVIDDRKGLNHFSKLFSESMPF